MSGWPVPAWRLRCGAARSRWRPATVCLAPLTISSRSSGQLRRPAWGAWPAGWRSPARRPGMALSCISIAARSPRTARSARRSPQWACSPCWWSVVCRCSTCCRASQCASLWSTRHRHPARLRGLQHPAARKPLFQHAERCALAHQPALRRAGRAVSLRPCALLGRRAVPPRFGAAVRGSRQRHRARRTADRHCRRAQPALGDRHPCLARCGVPHRDPGGQRHLPARACRHWRDLPTWRRRMGLCRRSFADLRRRAGDRGAAHLGFGALAHSLHPGR